MALLFCDGFDNPNADVTRAKWDEFHAATLETNERGAGALLAGRARLVRRLPKRRTFIVGCALKHSGRGVFIAFQDTHFLSYFFYIYFLSSGVITCGNKKRGYVNSALGVFPPGVMSFFECKVSFSRWFGSISARVDGIEVLSASFLRNAQRGSPFPSAISLVAHDGEAHVGDFYICDARGKTNNDYLGDVRVRSTPCTRLESDDGQRTARFSVPNVDEASSAILAAQVTSSLRKEGAGACDAAVALGSASQTSVPRIHRLSDSTRVFTDAFDCNPLNGQPWTHDHIRELGITVTEK